MPKLTCSSGAGILMVIFMTAFLLVCVGSLARISFNLASSTHMEYQRQQAFYLAEAAIERGKEEVSQNSLWYTDLRQAEDKNWLIDSARGLKGQLESGEYKVVKMQNSNILYGIGYSHSSRFTIKYDLHYYSNL